MAKRDFDCTALLFTLEGRVGKTLQDIAGEFGVSTRTVQRRMNEIRIRYPGVTIRESLVGRTKTFHYIRPPSKKVLSMSQRQVVTLHKLRMAANVFRMTGMVDHANDLDAFVEATLSELPRASRRMCESLLHSLSAFETFDLPRTKPHSNAATTEALRLANISKRAVIICLKNGHSFIAKVSGLRFKLNGRTTLHVIHADGSLDKIELRQIQKVKGTEDLLHEDLRDVA